MKMYLKNISALVSLIVHTSRVFPLRLNKVGRTTSVAVFTSKIDRIGGGLILS